MDPSSLPANRLAELTRSGKIGCRELLDHFIARVERHDLKINAVVVRDFDRARERAKALDNQADKPAPLFGVPMTVKESFDIAGLPTTWGVPAERDSIANRTALAVERLQAAGAVVFGKTNVPLLLADSQRNNEIYGTTNNPWDLKLSPGGSSGGSAAALAAGMTGLEIGSDIGSSIRNPAHYCGVFGHKPTWGIAPPLGQALRGNVAQSDISVIGPLARSADDLALALDAIAGPDDIEAVGWKLDLAPPRATRLDGLRVAVMTDHDLSEVDAAITGKIEALASFLSKQGARVSSTIRPDFDLAKAHRLYIEMLRASTSARLDGAAIQHWRAEAARLPATDASYYAMMARGNSMLHRDFLIGNEQRQRMRRAWAAFFKDWDVFLCPCRGIRGAAARPRRRTLGTHDRAEWPPRASDGPDVLGWHLVLLPAAGHGRTARLYASGVADRRADRRPAIRRPHHDRICSTNGTILAGLCRPARLGLRGAHEPDLLARLALGRTHYQQRDRLRRVARPLHRPRRQAEPAHQCGGGARPGTCSPARPLPGP
jgi:amidase